jgi:hypothetical protein
MVGVGSTDRVYEEAPGTDFQEILMDEPDTRFNFRSLGASTIRQNKEPNDYHKAQ